MNIAWWILPELNLQMPQKLERGWKMPKYLSLSLSHTYTHTLIDPWRTKHIYFQLRVWGQSGSLGHYKKSVGASLWLSGKESACQCRRHRFGPDLGRSHMPWINKPMFHNYWACARNGFSCGAQQLVAPQLASSLCSSEAPAQPKINKQKLFL